MILRIGTLTTLLLLFSVSGGAAPYPTQGSPVTPAGYGELTSRTLSDIDALRHGLRNHETELRQFDERFQNFETIIDSLRKQFQDNTKGQKEFVGSTAANLNVKISDLEQIQRTLASDLRLLKEHSNQIALAIGQFEEHLHEIDRVNELHGKYIEHLQSALKALTEAIQGKDSEPVAATAQIYKIKSGDSLEKIAAHHGTTVDAIKKLNNLTSDRIIVNQKLKIPEK